MHVFTVMIMVVKFVKCFSVFAFTSVLLLSFIASFTYNFTTPDKFTFAGLWNFFYKFFVAVITAEVATVIAAGHVTAISYTFPSCYPINVIIWIGLTIAGRIIEIN